MARTRAVHQSQGGKDHAGVTLEQLEIRFARFRRDHPSQNRIPDALRRDALEAVRLGVTPTQLRRACGISSDQLKQWRRNGDGSGSVAEPTPREARVFSVADELPALGTGAGHSADADELELRLGGWSISVRRSVS